MLGFARDVAFGTRWCFQGLCVTSSKSSLFHCRFFWTIVHTSCWASDSAFFKKTRFAMLFLRKSVLLGLALRETKAFFLVPFRRFSSNDKWPPERCRLGEAVAAASKTCSLHSKDYDPCFIHWYQGTFLSRDKWEDVSS